MLDYALDYTAQQGLDKKGEDLRAPACRVDARSLGRLTGPSLFQRHVDGALRRRIERVFGVHPQGPAYEIRPQRHLIGRGLLAGRAAHDVGGPDGARSDDVQKLKAPAIRFHQHVTRDLDVHETRVLRGLRLRQQFGNGGEVLLRGEDQLFVGRCERLHLPEFILRRVAYDLAAAGHRVGLQQGDRIARLQRGLPGGGNFHNQAGSTEIELLHFQNRILLRGVNPDLRGIVLRFQLQVRVAPAGQGQGAAPGAGAERRRNRLGEQLFALHAEIGSRTHIHIPILV